MAQVGQQRRVVQVRRASATGTARASLRVGEAALAQQARPTTGDTPRAAPSARRLRLVDRLALPAQQGGHVRGLSHVEDGVAEPAETYGTSHSAARAGPRDSAATSASARARATSSTARRPRPGRWCAPPSGSGTISSMMPACSRSAPSASAPRRPRPSSPRRARGSPRSPPAGSRCRWRTPASARGRRRRCRARRRCRPRRCTTTTIGTSSSDHLAQVDGDRLGDAALLRLDARDRRPGCRRRRRSGRPNFSASCIARSALR